MDKPTFTARTPVDLIAMAPLVLGFHPEDSIVMLTFGASPGRQFHARVSMPAPDDLDQVVEILTNPVVRHEIAAVALLIYTDDEVMAGHVASVLGSSLVRVGCELVDVLRVEDDTYQRLDEPWSDPVFYSIADHPFAAEAVLLGRRTFASRAEVADQLVGGSEEEVEEVRAATIDALPLLKDPDLQEALVRSVIRRWLESKIPPDCFDCGALVISLADEANRDVALSATDPVETTQLIELWIHVIRRCPQEFLPGPASVLAFSAWLAGDGALAWCALDKCLGEDPGHELGLRVAHFLEQAVPPQTWGEVGGQRSA